MPASTAAAPALEASGEMAPRPGTRPVLDGADEPSLHLWEELRAGWAHERAIDRIQAGAFPRADRRFSGPVHRRHFLSPAPVRVARPPADLGQAIENVADV